MVESRHGTKGDNTTDCEGGLVTGSPQRVPIALNDSFDNAQITTASIGRKKRFLPLSGKSPEALRDLVNRYLHWLDEQEKSLATDADTESALLADMAWTASTGRSHFEHRAGVIFSDIASLRAALSNLSIDGTTVEGKPLGKLAFVFTGEVDLSNFVKNEQYDREPVVQRVLNCCDHAIRTEFDYSLLDVIEGEAGSLDHPANKLQVTFAIQCAVAALWSSIGIDPDLVAGYGVGELSAAWAAGVFSLEDGVRIARWCSEQQDSTDDNSQSQDLATRLKATSLAPLSVPLVSGTKAQFFGSGDTPDLASWYAQESPATEFSQCEEIFANQRVETTIEISSGADMIEDIARTYESGHKLDFAGLFAGELRRRISIPLYPFQRQSYWFNR